MNRTTPWIAIGCALLTAALWSGGAFGWWPFELPQRGDATYRVHVIILWACAAVALIAYAVMFWSIVHYRRSKGADAEHFHSSTMTEIMWTLIPLLILVILALPAARALLRMGEEPAPAAPTATGAAQVEGH